MDRSFIPASMISGGRILVVDDEPDIRDALSDYLELEGYVVETASNGRRALSLIETRTFDAVLTDLNMSGMDGMDLLGAIREISLDLPVVVITGYPTLQRAVDVMKSGAADFLTKPFEMADLLHTLRRVLRERALSLENQRLAAEVNNKAVIEKLNRELHSKVAELTKLNIISEHLGRLLDTDQLFDEVVSLAADLTEAHRVSLMLYDRRRQALRIRAASGLNANLIKETVVRIGEGIAGQVALTRIPMRVTRKSGAWAGSSNGSASRYGAASWVSVPLLIGGELFGVLNVTERRGGTDFGAEDERILISLAEKAAVKIENNALYESLYDNLLDTLHALVTTIEAKDPYTHSHSRRVTEMAVALAKRMGLPRDAVEALRFATMLHDIGKIGVRDSVLMKSGKLSADEYRTIMEHPVIGDRIVEPLGLSEPERDIIRHHHEKLDGTGYPDGLRGEQISMLARIVTAADAFDAMTSTRSYRQAMSIEQALSELRRCEGSQFDPEIVRHLRSGIDAGEIQASIHIWSPEIDPPEIPADAG